MIITSERMLLVFGASPAQMLFATLGRASLGAVPLASLARAANPEFRPAPTASAHLPRNRRAENWPQQRKLEHHLYRICTTGRLGGS